ncbi:MAG: hypothetical protein ACI8Z5_001113 [Lentimonas sp.]|jgi:hypothetical protein
MSAFFVRVEGDLDIAAGPPTTEKQAECPCH